MLSNVQLPIDVINTICEWSTDESQIWVPSFCPKTHKLRCKVNKHSKLMKENAEIMFTRPAKGLYPYFDNFDACRIIMEDSNNFDNFETNEFNAIVLKKFNPPNIYQWPSVKLYFEFDSETDKEKQEKFIFRASCEFECYNGLDTFSTTSSEDLYLNGTLYATIRHMCIDTNNNTIEIDIESF